MSDERELPATVEELIERAERSRTAFYAALEGLGPEQLAAPITGGGWSAIDHMAHIAIWMEGILAAFDRQNRWVAMGADGPPGSAGFDELNERLRAPHAAKSPAEVRAWLDTTHERIASRLQAMTIEELRRPYGYYQPEEERDDSDAPFLGWVVGDTYSHYDEHAGWLREALSQSGGVR